MSEELREKAKPTAYQQLKDGKWVECSHFVAFGWGDVIDKECRPLYSEADYLALLSANEGMRKALGQILAIIIEMRDKHSSPNGDNYACGQWDMAQRLFGKIDKIVSETLSPSLNSKLAPAGEGEANG